METLEQDKDAVLSNPRESSQNNMKKDRNDEPSEFMKVWDMQV